MEADPGALRVVRENTASLRLPGAEVRAGRAEKTVAGPAPGQPYDVVFLDPPYDVGDDELREILLTLLANDWLSGEALVTVERRTRGGEFGWPGGFEGLRSRRYGEATFWYGRAAEVTAGS